MFCSASVVVVVVVQAKRLGTFEFLAGMCDLLIHAGSQGLARCLSLVLSCHLVARVGALLLAAMVWHADAAVDPCGMVAAVGDGLCRFAWCSQGEGGGEGLQQQHYGRSYSGRHVCCLSLTSWSNHAVVSSWLISGWDWLCCWQCSTAYLCSCTDVTDSDWLFESQRCWAFPPMHCSMLVRPCGRDVPVIR